VTFTINDAGIEILRRLIVAANVCLTEQRREFARGDFGDLDDLEDALKAVDCTFAELRV
jgi:hypothetical protein